MVPDLPGFRVDSLLARGGTSDVWLAWSREATPRPVAVKVARPGAPCEPAGWWRAHGELLARCDHPGLLGIDAVLDTAAGPAIVLPYVVGGSVADLLDDIATLMPGEVAALVADVADAVAALHTEGVVHGDLTAANVLLTATGQPLVADARALPMTAPAPEGPTAGADVPGGVRPAAGLRATPGYLAPEVAAGARPDVAADVFAVGVLAYEALTGVLPHRGTVDEVLAAAAEGAHRPLANWTHVPPAMASAVEAALDPDPGVRPDLTALAAALIAAVPSEEVRQAVPARSVAPVSVDRSQTVAIGVQPRPDAPVRKRRPAIRLAVAAAAASVLVATALLGGTPGREVQRPNHPPATIHTGQRATTDPRTCGGRGGTWSQPLGTDPVPVASAAGGECVDTAQWEAGVMTVARVDGTHRRRYAVGRAGDQVLVGDWDGDGRDGLAVYEPDRGRVLSTERLPVDAGIGAVARAERVEIVERNGHARVVANVGGGRSKARVEVRVPPGR